MRQWKWVAGLVAVALCGGVAALVAPGLREELGAAAPLAQDRSARSGSRASPLVAARGEAGPRLRELPGARVAASPPLELHRIESGSGARWSDRTMHAAGGDDAGPALTTVQLDRLRRSLPAGASVLEAWASPKGVVVGLAILENGSLVAVVCDPGSDRADVNRDGVIDAGDMALAAQLIAEGHRAGDVTGDGRADAADLLALRDRLAGGTGAGR